MGSTADFQPGQPVKLLVPCGELRAGETLIVFDDGERQWASRDGTDKTARCSGEHVPDDPLKFGPVWEPIEEATNPQPYA